MCSQFPFHVLPITFQFPFLSFPFHFFLFQRPLSPFCLLSIYFHSFSLPFISLSLLFPVLASPCLFFHVVLFLSIPFLFSLFPFHSFLLSMSLPVCVCPFCALSVPSLVDLGNSSRARDFCRPCETSLLKAAVWAGASGTCTRPRCAYSSPSGSWASPALPAFSVPPARQDTRRRTLLLRASCLAEAWLQFGHSLR